MTSVHSEPVRPYSSVGSWGTGQTALYLRWEMPCSCRRHPSVVLCYTGPFPLPSSARELWGECSSVTRFLRLFTQPSWKPFGGKTGGTTRTPWVVVERGGGGAQDGRGTGCCALILVELKPMRRDYVLKYVASLLVRLPSCAFLAWGVRSCSDRPLITERFHRKTTRRRETRSRFLSSPSAGGRKWWW